MSSTPPAPDLRILALADAHLLPREMQATFDRWRSLRARDAVAQIVRKRLIDDAMLMLMLERLEAADDEGSIFEGIYALAEIVDLHRKELGLHSHYLIVIMSGHINPWSLLALSRDFADPPASVTESAEELWQLARAHRVDVWRLLQHVRPDDTLRALEAFYRARSAR